MPVAFGFPHIYIEELVGSCCCRRRCCGGEHLLAPPGLSLHGHILQFFSFKPPRCSLSRSRNQTSNLRSAVGFNLKNNPPTHPAPASGSETDRMPSLIPYVGVQRPPPRHPPPPPPSIIEAATGTRDPTVDCQT